MIKLPLLVVLSFSLAGCSSSEKIKIGYPILITESTKQKINDIINNDVIPNQTLSYDEKINRISATFLGTPYVANTLIGGPEQQETLVANFEGVDCFTYLDYVVALSLSNNEKSFLNSLVNTRYKDSQVTYYKRKHFFTDWYAVAPKNAIDVTATISPNSITVEKNLNIKSDGSEYIKGLGAIPRTITYIPGNRINQSVIDNIKTGDYIGVYSPISGLDVSHTGFAIKKDGQLWYRNASSLSKNNKVVDTPFLEYMSTRPGILVLRSISK
ncbi:MULTISPECIES: DUF1460 domain-containing protein [unclassified Providencia]|uniref:DUF1460 domain-containing protein n=1 Tax=unclassified Providencia TaxID=2633465 RepID=UPI0023494C04|nr:MULTISPECIES: DUF1460 domain-containing protein [unclassified Providencia]